MSENVTTLKYKHTMCSNLFVLHTASLEKYYISHVEELPHQMVVLNAVALQSLLLCRLNPCNTL